jgi:ribonuclease P/MRP protein subunit RPP40
MEKTECEKDQGIFISRDLRWEEQVRHSASKGNRVLGMLKKTFVSRDPDLWKNLYTSLVRPHLEYAVQVWNPYLQKDVDEIERVQHRASRIPENFSNLEYEERLNKWGISTLRERRERGDAIQMFKTINKIEEIKWHREPRLAPRPNGLSLSRACKNQNSLAIQRETFPARNRNNHCHFVTTRHEFFLNRVAGVWNSLPDSVIQAPTINSFKARFDEFQKRLL